MWLIYYNSKNTWLKDKLVREYIDEDFSLTTTQEENMIDTVHTNIHNTTLATYRTHSNLWNVPERKVLIHSNSWNEFSKKTDHSNWDRLSSHSSMRLHHKIAHGHSKADKIVNNFHGQNRFHFHDQPLIFIIKTPIFVVKNFFLMLRSYKFFLGEKKILGQSHSVMRTRFLFSASFQNL